MQRCKAERLGRKHADCASLLLLCALRALWELHVHREEWRTLQDGGQAAASPGSGSTRGKVALWTGCCASCLSFCPCLYFSDSVSVLSTFSNSVQGTGLINLIACPIGEQPLGLKSANGWARLDQVTSPVQSWEMGSHASLCTSGAGSIIPDMPSVLVHLKCV